MNKHFLIIFIALFLASCTENPKDNITELLDARDLSISEKNINNYTSLISKKYLKKVGNTPILNMERVFSTFKKVEMTSRDRDIQVIDDDHALCNQTYVLKVFADGEWRNIVEREQLKLRREDGKWKIDSGL